MKKYKYITIAEVSEESLAGKPCYEITNNRSGDILGGIAYHWGWKRHIATFHHGCVFSTDCLQDIISFMNELNGGN
jgi:hypothetical protein